MSDSNSSEETSSFTFIYTMALAIPCMLLAELASRTAINQVKIETNTITKRRKRFADLFRIPGNLILRFRKAPVQVLSKKDWHARETKLSGATPIDGDLVIDRLDGIPLAELLAEEDSSEEKLAAISVAMRSLFEFHLRFDQSHGDASATNVMICELQDGDLSATWFDFDVAHDESAPEVIRRADDLRALLYTSKLWLEDQDFVTLFPDWNSFYADDDVWEELIATMGNPIQHCDIFHLAQQKRVWRRVH